MKNGTDNDECVMDVVSRALRQPPEERASFLRGACAGDAALYIEAAKIVRGEERMGSFMRRPAIDAAPVLRPFQAGEIVSDRFEIIQEIGEGGMGIVYVAFDRRRNQRIAIKSAKPGFRRLLSPELEGALKVRHPNVCLVNEIHTAQTSQGEVDFLTMELLEGETLASRLARDGALDFAFVRDVACQLCAGLAEAHRSNILHRDFKSANVFLCPDVDGKTRAVITDFGLACDVDQVGETGGTPRYMAPELRSGERTSKASDVYALGVVLIEMISGQAAFNPGIECRTEILTRLGPLASGLKAQFAKVVSTCLSVRPEDRPADASLVLSALVKRSPRKAPWLVLTLLFMAPLASTEIRERIHDYFWPPPSIRLALLPIDGLNETTISAQGLIQDVSDRVGQLQGGRRTVVVIPNSQIAENRVHTFGQARQALHATHALQTKVRRETNGIVVDASVIDLSTQLEVRSFSGRYGLDTVGAIPEALAETVALTFRLQRPTTPERLSPTASIAYDRGLFLLHRDDASFDEAISQLQEAIREDPRSSLPLAAMVEALISKFKATNDRGSLAKARGYLGAAESLNPDSVRVRLMAGLLEQTAGHYEKAVGEYRRAQDLDPRNVETLLHLASAYNELDQNNEAVATYQKAIALEPGYYRSHRKLGQYYYFRSKYPEAAEELQKAIERAPGLFDAYNDLGGILTNLGQNDGAERALLTSISLRDTADAENNLGALRAYQMRDAEAVEFYKRALDLDSHQYLYLMNLGDSARRLGRLREAANAYRKALGFAIVILRGDPRDGYTRAFVGYLSARAGDSVRAEEEITQAMELSPSDTQVLRRAVLTYEALGERDRALEIATEAPLTMLRELDRQPDLAEFRKDARFKQVVAEKKNGVQ